MRPNHSCAHPHTVSARRAKLCFAVASDGNLDPIVARIQVSQAHGIHCRVIVKRHAHVSSAWPLQHCTLLLVHILRLLFIFLVSWPSGPRMVSTPRHPVQAWSRDRQRMSTQWTHRAERASRTSRPPAVPRSRPEMCQAWTQIRATNPILRRP